MKNANFCEAPTFIKKKLTSSQKRGLLYEKRALKIVKEVYPNLDRKWIVYEKNDQKRLCEPDSFLILDNRLIIFEVKLNWKAHAYWKMETLYGPLLKMIYPKLEQSYIQICRHVLGHKEKKFYKLDNLPQKGCIHLWV